MPIPRYATVIATISFVLGLMLSPSHSEAADAVPEYVTAAINDSGRPDADKQRDELRKPADMILFSGIKPGDKVSDFFPGGGYFTRIFSKVVGPDGSIYAYVPEEVVKKRATAKDAVEAIAADPAYTNVKVLVGPTTGFNAPEPLDIVWTSQNYHDLHTKGLAITDVVAFDKAVFEALKPGGVFIVLDHAAEAGSGLTDTDKLHRIDPDVVKAEVLAAGFVLEDVSTVLNNPDDPHTAMVFDPSIRGKTDQFIFKFRKPAP